MATRLKNMKLTSVDLVRAGANQEADICLFKSADPPEATEKPTEHEKNIFKRFLAWLQNEPTEAENEPQNPIEKAEDNPDLESLYKSALAESLASIMKDNTLTDIEKRAMTDESLRQYEDKLRELERLDELEDRKEDRHEREHPEAEIKEEILEEIYDDDDDRYDEIEEIEMHKFNQNHDSAGKISSAPGGAGGRGANYKGWEKESKQLARMSEPEFANFALDWAKTKEGKYPFKTIDPMVQAYLDATGKNEGIVWSAINGEIKYRNKVGKSARFEEIEEAN